MIKSLKIDRVGNPVSDINPDENLLTEYEATKLSRNLSHILRHSAFKQKIPITQNGYISIDILSKHMFKTVEIIAYIVKYDDKERYKMVYKKNDDQIYIRANQGHSMEGIEIEMETITDSTEYPTAVHGTYYKAWNMIKDTGLNKMARQHIHFAKGLPGESGVISGMRGNCQVLIYVDIAKMLNDGIKIYCSDNGVILSEGINGVIAPEYFAVVLDGKTGKQIYPEKENIEPKKIVGGMS